MISRGRQTYSPQNHRYSHTLFSRVTSHQAAIIGHMFEYDLVICTLEAKTYLTKQMSLDFCAEEREREKCFEIITNHKNSVGLITDG